MRCALIRACIMVSVVEPLAQRNQPSIRPSRRSAPCRASRTGCAATPDSHCAMAASKPVHRRAAPVQAAITHALRSAGSAAATARASAAATAGMDPVGGLVGYLDVQERAAPRDARRSRAPDRPESRRRADGAIRSPHTIAAVRGLQERAEHVPPRRIGQLPRRPPTGRSEGRGQRADRRKTRRHSMAMRTRLHAPPDQAPGARR